MYSSHSSAIAYVVNLFVGTAMVARCRSGNRSVTIPFVVLLFPYCVGGQAHSGNPYSSVSIQIVGIALVAKNPR